MKPQMPNLVGLCGNAGVGKDTFALPFHYRGFKQYAFAGPVKRCAAAAFGISEDYFHERDLKEEPHPYWKKSPREIAQLIGTELFRKQFGNDFWIRRMELQLILDFDSQEDVKAVISDVRFQNEAQWILDSGGILVHLTRPGYTGNVGVPGHTSEQGIDFKSLTTETHKHVIFKLENRGTKEDLQRTAAGLAQKLCGYSSLVF